MVQRTLFTPPLWTVSEITRYLRDIIESDHVLQDLWVQGEVSNLSRPASGHMYFTLKDANSSIRCVMWRPVVERQPVLPDNGDAIEAHGNINIYETAGQYQLYVDILRPAGEGLLYAEFLRLKSKLEAEGLFDPARKKPVPGLPEMIGIVTSPTGAALRDILDTIRRRYPLVQVVIAPTQVQGTQAPQQIIHALLSLNQLVQPDVILIARGGGSIEDLWAFNDEGVARAIAESVSPVITGIGHETDFTIADFVSDVRAPTPTAAAELATPNKEDILNGLAEISNGLLYSQESRISGYHLSLSQQMKTLERLSPVQRLRSNRQRIDEFDHRLNQGTDYRIDLLTTRVNSLHQQLQALNPYSILKRGYSSVTKPDGTVVRSIHQVEPMDEIEIRVEDGGLLSKVMEKKPRDD